MKIDSFGIYPMYRLDQNHRDTVSLSSTAFLSADMAAIAEIINSAKNSWIEQIPDYVRSV